MGDYFMEQIENLDTYSCFLFGHSTCPDHIFPQLVRAIEKLIVEEGTVVFIVGHRGAFDRLAERAVCALKEKYPHIRLRRLIAYYRPHGKDPYFPEGVDSTYYPEGLEFVPKPFAIVRANEMTVDNSPIVICYVCHTMTNTHKLYYRALRKGKKVINLGTLAADEEV